MTHVDLRTLYISAVVDWGILQDILLITGSVLIFGSQVTPLQIFGASTFLSQPSFFMLYASFIRPCSRSASPRHVVWVCRDSNDHHFNSTSLHHIYFAWPFFSSHCPPRVAPTGVRSSRCALSSCWCCNFYIVRFDLSLPRFRRKALPVRPPRDSWLHAHPLFPLIIYSCSLFVPLLSLLSCSHVTILILYCPFFSFPFFSLSNRALFGLPF